MWKHASGTKQLSLSLLTLVFPLVLAIWLGLVAFVPAYVLASPDVRVFVAASLKDAIGDANVRYRRATRRNVVVSFGGSDTLAEQIENGAPADIFISAD